MTEVTLLEILRAREERVKLQQQLLKHFQCPLVCFTMNIAGPVKNTPLIQRGFRAGLDALEQRIPSHDIQKRHIEIAATGCKVFHFGDAVDMKQVLELMPEDCLCLGNISPSKQFRHGTPKSIRLDTQRLLSTCNEHKNFLISSGCDVPPLTDWDNIDSFFNTVESFYYRQRLFDLVK